MLMFKSGIEKGLALMFLFLGPTVAGMVLLMKDIVTIVYERGQFTEAATQATTAVSIYYIGSVLFYSIQAVIAKGFYTLEKGHFILRVGVISIVLNVIFNAILSKVMGYQGLALSASLVGMIYCIITFTTLYKLVDGFNMKWLGKEYFKIALATMVMVGVLLLIMKVIPNDMNTILYLILMTIIGAIIYFVALLGTKSQSFKMLIKREAKAIKE
jgi:putative peptidoglycan lipid II flippase